MTTIKGIICAVILAGPTTAAAQAPQQDRNISYVTLAVAKNKQEAGRVKSFKNGRDVILVDRDNLAPEALATLLTTYVAARTWAGVKGKAATIRPTQSQPRPMTSRQRRHYIAILERLSRAEERVVPGVGKVQAIDLPFIGSR